MGSEQSQGQGVERFLDILGGAPIVVYTLAADGSRRPTYVSDHVQDLTGFPPARFLDGPHFWESRVHADDARRLLAVMERDIADHGATTADYRFQAADGHWLWVRDTARLRRDARGRPVEIIGYWLDFTAIKMSETALHDQLALMECLLETLPSPVYVLGPDHCLLGCNPAFESLVGRSRNTLVGRPLAATLPAAMAADLTEGDAALLAGDGGRRVYEATIVGEGEGEGGARQVIVHKDRFLNAQGTIAGLLGEITDISEFRASRERLTDTVRRLEASNRDLEQFAYVAAHDLREPLRLVGSYLGLLKRRHASALDPQALEYIAYASDAVLRMNHLVQDLLRFAVAGRSRPAAKPRSLRDCLDAALTALRNRLEDNQAEVSVCDDLPITRLSLSDGEQVFEHLIDNAIKYRHPERPPRICIAVARHPGHYEIMVSDNGIGMDPAYAERVFQIFQRLHGWGDYPGTGIGLALAKKIIESQGGRIWLTSDPGTGTCIHFTVIRPRD
jgi:PAS domain S-box-containing protein